MYQTVFITNKLITFKQFVDVLRTKRLKNLLLKA
jgi:hypothetical protein